MNGFRAWKRGAVIAAAVCSTAEIPPISEQARAGIDRVLGTKGIYVSEESAYKFSFPRTDVSVRIGNQRLTPDQAPKSWVTFSPSIHSEGMVMGELIVLEHEANPILSVALNAGLEVTGLGAPLLGEQPKLLAMNITGQGTYQSLGSAVRRTLDEFPRIRASRDRTASAASSPVAPMPNHIDPSPLNGILSMRGTSTEGIYRASIGRISLINGTPIGREMGMRTTVAIFGTNDSAFLDVDLIVSPDELQRTLKALRLKGLEIASIRNHTVGEHPQVVFVRVSGQGSASELSKSSVRARRGGWRRETARPVRSLCVQWCVR